MGLLFGDSSNEAEELPIVRDYFKKVKSGKVPAPTQLERCLRAIFMSSSEEWLVIETGCCKAFLHTASKAAKILVKSLERALHDCKSGDTLKACGLVIVPSKQKSGFDLETSKIAGDWVQPSDSDDRAMFRFQPDEDEVLDNEVDEEVLLQIAPLTPKPARGSKTKKEDANTKKTSSD